MSDTSDLGHREIARRGTDELALVSSAIVARGLRDIARIEQPKEFTNSIGMRFVLIPAGEFMMGSSAEDVRTYLKADTNPYTEVVKAEQPQRRVKITQPFFMATLEVTQAQYKQVLGRNPSEFSVIDYRDDYR